ncbi:hypothetical protein [Butyrivibrio sp. MC2021]|uniref:hypothetical protein n=1 Tax=Butyrivibrio sp. MC2021 TaxID=1408306 RepID=UPI000A70210D|nr:hypothetical protein [Butyrivibrio sp. MC2021]
MRNTKELNAFRKFAVAYVVALYVLPQYFGVPNPVFDLTAVRITIIALLLLIITDYKRSHDFMDVILKEKVGLLLIPYIVVLVYTMVLRADVNAFLNPFVEFLELYLLIYLIKDTFGVDGMIRLIMACIYVLIFLGFVEIVMGTSPFSYLETIDGIYTGRFVRGGHYRIMSCASHSLGYGLMLVTMLPFCGYDLETKEYNVFRRPILLILMMVNVFQTGSRSTLGVSFAEIALMFILSDRKYLKANVIYLLTGLVAFGMALVVGFKTAFGNYVMLQITSLIDSLFNTTYSVAYGADLLQLRQSKAYRDLLKEIYHVDWVNPLLGLGRKRAFRSLVNGRVVKSIDNFYIAEFVRYAYPGMFAYIFFLAGMGISMVRDFFRTRSGITRLALIGGIMYCLNIKVVDSLQTFKYLYVLIALYICEEKTPFVPAVSEDHSKYIKKEKSYFARYK